jgi:hypothetical protein
VRKTILVAIVSLCFAASAFAQCEILNFDVESLPTFDLNTPANFQITASGGNAPYHFEIVEGALPVGLHMNSNGKITGKPTVPTFDTTIFVTVTDSSGCMTTRAYAVYVEDI